MNSPVLTLQLIFCFFVWAIAFTVFLKRHSIIRLAVAVKVRNIYLNYIEKEHQLKKLPMGDEREALFLEMKGLKDRIAEIEGMPTHSNLRPFPEHKPNTNVIPLHFRKKNKNAS